MRDEPMRNVMSFPLKVNQAMLPKWLSSIVPSVFFPLSFLRKKPLGLEEFSPMVSALREDGIWRTTEPRRHKRTDEAVRNLVPFSPESVVLDIGASDGTASLELIDLLAGNFRKFFVTDRVLSARVLRKRDQAFFFAKSGHCSMWATRLFVLYFQRGSSRLMDRFLVRLFCPSQPPGRALEEVSLLHPLLKEKTREDSRVVIQEFDIFETWKSEKPDFIKIANVLNRSYYSSCKMERAITNMHSTLKPNGHLVLIDNRETEKCSLFKKTGNRFKLMHQTSGGAETQGFFSEFSASVL